MHAAAVWPKQVKLGTHRAALRMWIPDNDSACMVCHVLYSLCAGQNRRGVVNESFIR
jgi:hypothetical protein